MEVLTHLSRVDVSINENTEHRRRDEPFPQVEDGQRVCAQRGPVLDVVHNDDIIKGRIEGGHPDGNLEYALGGAAQLT